MKFDKAKKYFNNKLLFTKLSKNYCEISRIKMEFLNTNMKIS